MEILLSIGKGSDSVNKYMEVANNCAKHGANCGQGGPFGAVIVDKKGNIIAKGNNMVLANNDPTAHAEVTVIREACKKLGTYDLSGYILYTSCEPCPMCLAAIIWANIKEVYYACTRDDAGKIGFRDDLIYNYLEGKEKELINLKQIDREDCIGVFEEYEKGKRIIY